MLPFKLEELAGRTEVVLAKAAIGDRERSERLLVVRKGLEYNGVPYVHMGLTRHGVDCATLLGRIFADCKLIPEPHILAEGAECKEQHLHIRFYPRDFYRHKGAEIYLRFVEQLCHRVDREPLPGDVLTYTRELRQVAHAALVMVWPDSVLHASSESGVSLDRGDQGLLGRDSLSGVWSRW